MALEPLEIALIIGAIAVFLIWGPSKIPELARSLGRARGEFSKASKEGVNQQDEPKPNSNEEKPDNELILIAQALEIKTEGKTKSQLAKEIIDKKSKQ
jgi:sec-independent protein translocase protein TatA